MILNRGSTMPIGTKIKLLPESEQPKCSGWQCIYEDDILPTGVITDKKLTHGLLDIRPGFNIEKSNGKTYRVPLDVKFEVLDGELPEKYFINAKQANYNNVCTEFLKYFNIIPANYTFYKISPKYNNILGYSVDYLDTILEYKYPIYTFDEWLILINKSKKVKTKEVISTFKEGDWITLLDKRCCYGILKDIEVDKAYQILESGVSTYYDWSYSVHNAPEKFFCFADNMNNLSKCLRASTPEEIELAKNSTPIGWKPGDFWEHKDGDAKGTIGTELQNDVYVVNYETTKSNLVKISDINEWVKKDIWIINPVKSETMSLEEKMKSLGFAVGKKVKVIKLDSEYYNYSKLYLEKDNLKIGSVISIHTITSNSLDLGSIFIRICESGYCFPFDCFEVVEEDEWKIGDVLPSEFLNSNIKINFLYQNEIEKYNYKPNFVGDRVVDYILDSYACISGTNKILLLGLKKDYPTYNTFLNNFKPKQITKQDEKDNNISSWSKDNDRQSSCSSSRKESGTSACRSSRKESGTSAYIPGDSYGISIGQRRKGTSVRSI